MKNKFRKKKILRTFSEPFIFSQFFLSHQKISFEKFIARTYSGKYQRLRLNYISQLNSANLIESRLIS